MKDAAVICATGVCVLFALLIVREVRKDWTPYLLLAAALLFAALTLPGVREIVSFARELESSVRAVGDGEVTGIVLRALGIAWLTSAAAELCRASGESSVAGWIETAGRVELIALSLPLLKELLAAAGFAG